MKYFSVLLIFTSLAISQLPKSLGNPSGYDEDQLIQRRAYVLAYAREYKQARWVAYELKKSNLGGNVIIVKNYKKDLNIKGARPDKKDYSGSGYNIGHLAPPEDFKWSGQALNEVYFYSNTTPQSPYFRKTTWKRLEEQVRHWLKIEDSLYVVTGPVLAWGMKTIGKNEVTVPESYYKIVVKETAEETKTIAFLIKNERTTKRLKHFVVSIDSVESVTGMDFFPELNEKLEEKIESQVNSAKWKFKY